MCVLKYLKITCLGIQPWGMICCNYKLCAKKDSIIFLDYVKTMRTNGEVYRQEVKFLGLAQIGKDHKL